MALRPGTQQRSEQIGAIQAANAEYDDDNHSMLVQWYEDSEEATRDARLLSERDRDYYDNKQLTAEEIKALRERGQPEVVINRIQTKVNFLLGYEAEQRTDPRGFPRNPADEDAAGACSDVLRFLKDNTKADRVFSDVWENMIIEGYGGAELGLEQNAEGGNDITLTHVPWDRLFYDPHSRRDDFSDARYNGIVIWMDFEDAIGLWPDGEDVLNRTIDDEFQRTYMDRPSWKQWAMHGAHRKRVRIVQMYYRKGDMWRWCIFTKSGKLAGGEVIFVDEKGRSFNPLLMQSAFIDRDNNRYGFVRSLISPQDEINKRRSRLLHQSMGRPIQMEHGAVDDVDALRREMRKADGVIETNQGLAFNVLDTSIEVAAQTELLRHATQEIELQGPNAVLQGKGARNASGRAKLIDQQGGQTEIYPLMDNLGWFKNRIYSHQWAIVRNFWTEQKWVRVTDDEKKIRFVGFNRPVTVAEDLLQQAIENGVPEEEAKAQLAEQAQDPVIRMQMQQIARVENVPAEMNMDIIIEEVPDTANLQQEQFEILAQLAQAGIQFPPKVYIRASALRDKDELIEILEEQQKDPMLEEAAKVQIETAIAELEKLRAEIEEIKAGVVKDRAAAVKTLAEADAVDKQFGQVIDPNVVSRGQGSGAGGQNGQSRPQQSMPQSLPPAAHEMPDGSMMAGDEMPSGGYPPPAAFASEFTGPPQAGF